MQKKALMNRQASCQVRFYHVCLYTATIEASGLSFAFIIKVIFNCTNSNIS